MKNWLHRCFLSRLSEEKTQRIGGEHGYNETKTTDINSHYDYVCDVVSTNVVGTVRESDGRLENKTSWIVLKINICISGQITYKGMWYHIKVSSSVIAKSSNKFMVSRTVYDPWSSKLLNQLTYFFNVRS